MPIFYCRFFPIGLELTRIPQQNLVIGGYQIPAGVSLCSMLGEPSCATNRGIEINIFTFLIGNCFWLTFVKMVQYKHLVFHWPFLYSKIPRLRPLEIKTTLL